MKCERCFFTDRAVAEQICQRCSRNFTRAEILELAVIGLVYLFVCRFAWYLFTGDFVERALAGGSLFSVSWSNVFTFPVNFDENPWHIVTVALVYSLVILIPVAAGFFYGLAGGLIIAAGAWFVPAPFTFAFTMLGAGLAASRLGRKATLKTTLFVSTVPALVWLLAISAAPLLSPGVGIVAWFPWLLAGFFIAIAVSPMLWLAERRDYKATFLLPTFALLAAGAVTLFYATVGFSKVEYEFMRRDHWVGGPAFTLLVPPDRGGGDNDTAHRAALASFESRRARSIKEFSRFISWFPHSPQTPAALFERAELSSAKACFAGTIPDRLRIYTDRIGADAQSDDATIVAQFPQSPAGVEARLRLVEYALQNPGLAKETGLAPVRRNLQRLLDIYGVKLPADYRPGSTKAVGLKWREHRLTEEQERQQIYEVMDRARAKQAFLDRNSDYNDLPLMMYCQLDPHDPRYVDKLRDILTWTPDTKLADVIELDILLRVGWKPADLQALLARYPAGQTAPRIYLLLARERVERSKLAEARSWLKKLTEGFPRTPEADEGRRMLAELESGSQRKDSKP